jgi:hypothetical protein
MPAGNREHRIAGPCREYASCLGVVLLLRHLHNDMSLCIHFVQWMVLVDCRCCTLLGHSKVCQAPAKPQLPLLHGANDWPTCLPASETTRRHCCLASCSIHSAAALLLLPCCASPPYLHDCLRCLQELPIDLQPALLNGATQLPARCWRVVIIDARQRAERVDDIRGLCLYLEDLQEREVLFMLLVKLLARSCSMVCRTACCLACRQVGAAAVRACHTFLTFLARPGARADEIIAADASINTSAQRFVTKSWHACSAAAVRCSSCYPPR